ncbi:hypothetical protein PG997_001857 [Apiospora hydei]|uniref:Uncharacterized protein n=1 Tax=Apiospora hydei TaxID=1337664 RepID=A0ABR1X7Q7_9PEZI
MYLLKRIAVALSLAPIKPRAGSFMPLNITALASRNQVSVLECWQLNASVPTKAMSAMNYFIGNTTSATWSIIEPNTTPGEAWAPAIQLTMVMNGLIRITAPAPSIDPNCIDFLGNKLPTCPQVNVAYMMPGTLASSVIIAADMQNTSTLRGHFTEFPSNEQTVLVQAPFEGNVIPEHVVLHDGACMENQS